VADLHYFITQTASISPSSSSLNGLHTHTDEKQDDADEMAVDAMLVSLAHSAFAVLFFLVLRAIGCSMILWL
jgi:hypothetical protein